MEMTESYVRRERGKPRRVIHKHEIKKASNESPGEKNELDLFTQEVFDRMLEEGVPRTPHNYSLYFERMLEERDEAFVAQVNALLELEEVDRSFETIVAIEKELKEGHKGVKCVMQSASCIHKNIDQFLKITKGRKSEITKFTNRENVSREIRAFLSMLEKDTQKVEEITKEQIKSMRKAYNDTIEHFKVIENESVVDERYGVYNKRYLMQAVSREQARMKELGHESSLLAISLPEDTQNGIDDPKVVESMNRTVAGILMKIFRKNDIVAHLNRGIFMIMLKHSGEESAKTTKERIETMLNRTVFFTGETEFFLETVGGYTLIDTQLSAEECVFLAMRQLQEEEARRRERRKKL